MRAQTGIIRAMMAQKRTLSPADKRAINRAGQENMIQEIQEIESRAHALGMHVTAHALNRAKNALGWEISGDIEQAGKAALRK